MKIYVLTFTKSNGAIQNVASYQHYIDAAINKELLYNSLLKSTPKLAKGVSIQIKDYEE